MRISAGCQIVYDCPQSTPMLLMINPHPSRASDLIGAHQVRIDPPLPMRDYGDSFGNICTRIVAPPGRLIISTRLQVADSGMPDSIMPTAWQHRPEDLPDEMLIYLLGSRSINIYSQATDAGGIAKDIASALRRSIFVDQATTGLA